MILRGYKLLSFTSNTEFTVTEKKNEISINEKNKPRNEFAF